ncbi:restriction endonuclease subunit S [Tamlana flava]|uniref:restriction endonuclease subunit S n=1 Tax=Tamlana flava TaxID=3158572 RepID=UPI00351B6C23
MMEQKQVPELRFAEFKDEWIKASLQDLCDKTISYGIVQTGENIEKGIPCVRVVDLTNSKLDIYSMIKTSEEVSNSYKKTILEENEIMLALRGDIGMVKLVGKELVGANLTRGVARISARESIITPSFMNWVLQSEKSIKSINEKVNGSALKEIPLSGLRRVKVVLSKALKEQKKIASFLSSVDKKIEQLNKKKSLLEQYKKGVMQQLFSQKLRFKDDDGSDYPEWRKGKMKDFGRFYYGKSAPKWSISDDAETPCVRYGELYSTYNGQINEIKSYTNIKRSELKFSKGGEILIPRVGEDPLDFAHCSVLNLSNVAIGEMISVYNTKEESLFTVYCINSTLKKEFAKVVEGGNVSNLYFKYLEEIFISFPCIEEQTKIANFLSAIDTKIALLNTQIENTQQFKKGLLQQMFV